MYNSKRRPLTQHPTVFHPFCESSLELHHVVQQQSLMNNRLKSNLINNLIWFHSIVAAAR